VVLLLVAVAVGVHHLHTVTGFEGRRASRISIVRMYDAIRQYVHEQGVRRPLIEIDDAVWSDAAGVLLRLYQDGTPFAVPAALQPMFTDAFAATGNEDAVVTIGPSQGRDGPAPPHPAIVIYQSRTTFVAAH
jgi:hypothetical protein